MLLFWVGFLTCLWVFTVGAGAYGFWRYCYAPWVVMRKDLGALNAKFEEFAGWARNEIGLRKAMAATDPELARQESRIMRARRLWSEDVAKNPPA